ncbi:MAG: HNH endonuclease [Desulfobacteraceae bacterium]|nr:HNH endonuclease [Desulfobacteraceae bacterium]
MGNNQVPKIYFLCAYCGELAGDRPSHFKLKKRHFCSQDCYSKFRKELLPKDEHPRWIGGISSVEARKRWKKKHPERMAFLRHKEYLRHKNVMGSHSLEDWLALKDKHNYKCAICKRLKPLTKDHIVPLSKGGTDFINNIQPLCRNCNSQKWQFLNFNVYMNPGLLKE